MELPEKQAFCRFGGCARPDRGVGAVKARVNMYYHVLGSKPQTLTPKTLQNSEENDGGSILSFLVYSLLSFLVYSLQGKAGLVTYHWLVVYHWK